MVAIDQLKKDSHKLDHYIHKLNQKGRNKSAYKLQKKHLQVIDSIKELTGG